MSTLPSILAWTLLIFIQFTPFTGEEDHRRYAFTMTGMPGVRLVFDVTCVKEPTGKNVVGVNVSFEGPAPETGALTAALEGFGSRRTLVNVEDGEGVDQVAAGTREELRLRPDRKRRLAVLSGDGVERAKFVRESKGTPREIEFEHAGERARIAYDPEGGLKTIALAIPGLDVEPEFTSVPEPAGGAKVAEAVPPADAPAPVYSPKGIAAVVDAKGWAIVDRQGKVLLRPFIFDNGPDDFAGGLARFRENGKIGFYDESGKIVIPATFDFAWPFEDGIARVGKGCREVRGADEHVTVEGGAWSTIDRTGKLLGPWK